MHKYIGRVFNADTGECVELLTVIAKGYAHAWSLVLENTDGEQSERREFIDVKKFHEPGSVKAPQIGV